MCFLQRYALFVPTYSQKLSIVDQVHLLEWARAVIATTLGVLPSRALPPLMMQQEVDSVWDQICMSPSPTLLAFMQCMLQSSL